MVRYLVLFLFLFIDLQAGQLRVLLVGDTTCNISEQLEVDLALMKKESIKLSKHLKRPLDLKVIEGRRVDRREVLTTLDRMRVDPDDILMVFYTGHGFRNHEKRSKFPFLYFTRTREALDMEELIHKTYNKRAQFALVIVDACNLPFAHLEEGDGGRMISKDFNTEGNIRCNLAHLFENRRGVLAIASAAPGEVAYASHYGGYFTQAFLDTLYTNNCSVTNNWETLLNSIKYKTGDIQHPIYSFYN